MSSHSSRSPPSEILFEFPPFLEFSERMPLPFARCRSLPLEMGRVLLSPCPMITLRYRHSLIRVTSDRKLKFDCEDAREAQKWVDLLNGVSEGKLVLFIPCHHDRVCLFILLILMIRRNQLSLRVPLVSLEIATVPSGEVRTRSPRNSVSERAARYVCPCLSSSSITSSFPFSPII